MVFLTLLLELDIFGNVSYKHKHAIKIFVEERLLANEVVAQVLGFFVVFIIQHPSEISSRFTYWSAPQLGTLFLKNDGC